MDRFGTRVRDARLALGLTQFEAANGLCSQQDWIDIESGQLEPGTGLRHTIATRVGITIDTADSSARSDHATVLAIEAALRHGDWKLASSLLPQAPAGAAHTLLCEALVLERTGDFRGALALLDRASAEHRIPPALRMRLTSAKCRCLRYAGDLSRSIEVAEEALASTKGSSNADPELIAELRSTLAGTYCETGDLQRALDLTQDMADRVRSPWITATRLWARSMVLERAGRKTDSVAAAFESLVALRGLDQTRTLARMQNNAAWLALQAPGNDLQHVAELLSDSESTLRSAHAVVDLTFVLTTKAECQIRTGDSEGARQSLTEALSLIAAEDAGLRARITAAAAQLFASIGDADTAMQHLLTARELLENSGAKRSAAAVWRDMAETYATLGQQDLQIVCLRAAMDLLEL